MLACAASAGSAAQQTWTIKTADGDRDAIVLTAAAEPRPTVIVLHGALSSGSYTMRTGGFPQATARHGFHAVFPDGIHRQWNDGREDRPGAADDVAFLRALVERLIATRIAEPGRIYLAGISNGGMMSLAMACRSPGLFAAIGTVIATMPARITACHLVPTPLVMINGTADPMVPFDGGPVGQLFHLHRGDVLGAMETARLFATVAGCRSTPTELRLAHRGEASRPGVTKIAWQGCDRAPVTLYRVDGGGHVVFGSGSFRPPFFGDDTDDVVSADVIVDAFAALRQMRDQPLGHAQP